MRITSKGQITIPQQVRRELGLEPGDEVSVVVQGDAHALCRPESPNARAARGGSAAGQGRCGTHHR